MERISLEKLKPGDELIALKNDNRLIVDDPGWPGDHIYYKAWIERCKWVKCKVYFIGWFSIVLEDMEGSKKGILWWDKKEAIENLDYYRKI